VNLLVKELENRSTFAKVIIKHQGACFFETQCIFTNKKLQAGFRLASILMTSNDLERLYCAIN